MTFRESNLVFHFSDEWNLIKLDEHHFYKQLSGRGFKGVDFLGVYREGIYLIEVKNYAHEVKGVEQQSLHFLLEETAVFSQKIAQKWMDTIRLIRMAERFYNRKWYGRLFNLLNKDWQEKTYRSDTLNSNSFVFWKQSASFFSSHIKNVHLVLWLELGESLSPEMQNQLIENLQLKLKKLIPVELADAIMVTNHSRHDLEIDVQYRVKGGY